MRFTTCIEEIFFAYLRLTYMVSPWSDAITKRESSSAGRASPCQGEGREFESRLSLNTLPRFCEAYCLIHLLRRDKKHPQTAQYCSPLMLFQCAQSIS